MSVHNAATQNASQSGQVIIPTSTNGSTEKQIVASNRNMLGMIRRGDLRSLTAAERDSLAYGSFWNAPEGKVLAKKSGGGKHPSPASNGHVMPQTKLYYFSLAAPIDSTLRGRRTQQQLEEVRYDAVACFWHLHSTRKFGLTTLMAGVYATNFILSQQDLIRQCRSRCLADYIAVGFRLAVKYEQHNDSIYPFMRDFWHFFPCFTEWTEKSSPSQLLEIEAAVLRRDLNLLALVLPHSYLNQFCTRDYYPQKQCDEYVDLASFLIALTTFSNGVNLGRHNVGSVLAQKTPKVIALAALVLAVKITNSDARFERVTPYPDSLMAATNISYSEVQQTTKTLCHLLRNKPPQSRILKFVYPRWGGHSWE